MVISREVHSPPRRRGPPQQSSRCGPADWSSSRSGCPYDNGLRPEPVIALGALLTWCSIERAIATGRLLPAAVAVLIAAFSLAAGPSGLICIAALIAGARPILQILIARGHDRWASRRQSWRRSLAAGTVVLVAVFARPDPGDRLEATRVRTAVGPNVAWFDERLRWDSLHGHLAGRFAGPPVRRVRDAAAASWSA